MVAAGALLGAAGLAAGLAAAGAVEPPLWGGALAWEVDVLMTAPSDSAERPVWHLHYAFDSGLPADRYDHGQGQGDEICSLAAASRARPGAPCTVIMRPKLGALVIVPSAPPGEQCCRCADKSLGPVRIDWLRRSKATYEGRKEISGVQVDEWLTYAQFDNHYYATVDAAHRPVRFMEHKKDKLKQWDFDLDSFRAGPVNRTLFDVPADCTSFCSGCEQSTAQV